MFQRSPCLTYLYGALDTTPPPPKYSTSTYFCSMLYCLLNSRISKFIGRVERFLT